MLPCPWACNWKPPGQKRYQQCKKNQRSVLCVNQVLTLLHLNYEFENISLYKEFNSIPSISDGTGDNTLLENITHVAFKLHIPPTLHHNPGPAWQLLAVACLSMSDDIMAKPCVLGCENNWENQQKTPDLSLSNFWQGRLFLENTPNPFFSERTHPIFPERPVRGKALLDSLRGI